MMRRRLAKKILGNPWKYTESKLVRASFRLAWWWTKPHHEGGWLLDAPGMAYMARSMGGGPPSTAAQRSTRVQRNKWRGRHDFNSIPF